MDISAVISENMIFPCVEAENKRQLFQLAAGALAKSANVDKSRIFEALWERENLGSTGYGDGIAVPHARLEGLSKVVSVFIRLAKGIDFDAYDGKDVDLAAVIISPEQNGEDHLQLLAAFSRVLKNVNECSRIRQAKSAHEIYTVLSR